MRLILKGKKLSLDNISYWAPVIIIVSIFFVGLFYFRVIQYCYLDHGDAFEDSNILTFSNNFIKFGFIRCRFLPVSDIQVDGPQNFYTHSPPLQGISIALIRQILVNDSLERLRFFSICIACSILFFWFLLLRKLFDYKMALLGLFFLAVNPLFLSFSDSLSRWLSMEFYRILALFCFISLLEIRGKRRKIILVVMWFLLFIIGILCYEYIVIMYIIMFGYGFLFKKQMEKRYWLVLLSAPVAAFLLHYFQNVWALGGFGSAYNDLFSSFLHRTVGKGRSEIDTSLFTLGNWFKFSLLNKLRFVDMFSTRCLALPILLAIIMVPDKCEISPDDRKKLLNILKFWLLLFISGLSWWIVFVQHSWVHSYQTALHMLLASVFLSSMAFYLIYFFVLTKLIRHKLLNIIVIIAVSLSLLNIGKLGVLKSDLPLTKSKREAKILFRNYSRILTELGRKMDKDEYIYTNYWNYMVIEYYSDRNSRYITNLEQLKNAKYKDRYFLLFLFNDKDTRELYDYLKYNYLAVGSYEAQNIPHYNIMQFIIFEKVS